MAKIIILCLVTLAVYVSADTEQTIKAPYQVSLSREGTGHICSGAILNSEWILTCAKCVDGHEANEILVTFGSGVSSNLKSVHKHPSYDDSSHDLALLQIATPVEFNEKVQPIDLPSATVDGEVDVIRTAYVLNDLSPMEKPKEFQLMSGETYSIKQCEKILGSDSALCQQTVFVDDTVTLCRGNAGDPLVIQLAGKLELIGVMITGVTDCPKGQPSVGQRVSFYKDWIEPYLLNITL